MTSGLLTPRIPLGCSSLSGWADRCHTAMANDALPPPAMAGAPPPRRRRSKRQPELWESTAELQACKESSRARQRRPHSADSAARAGLRRGACVDCGPHMTWLRTAGAGQDTQAEASGLGNPISTTSLQAGHILASVFGGSGCGERGRSAASGKACPETQAAAEPQIPSGE